MNGGSHQNPWVKVDASERMRAIEPINDANSSTSSLEHILSAMRNTAISICVLALSRSIFLSVRRRFPPKRHIHRTSTYTHNSENKDLHEFPISISHYIVRTVAIKFATKLSVYNSNRDDDDDGNGGGVQLKQTAMATAARMNLHYVYIDIYA